MLKAQLACSTAGVSTLLYAGQDLTLLQELNSKLATATIANTLNAFFIVDQVLKLMSKTSPYYLAFREKVSTTPW